MQTSRLGFCGLLCPLLLLAGCPSLAAFGLWEWPIERVESAEPNDIGSTPRRVAWIGRVIRNLSVEGEMILRFVRVDEAVFNRAQRLEEGLRPGSLRLRPRARHNEVHPTKQEFEIRNPGSTARGRVTSGLSPGELVLVVGTACAHDGRIVLKGVRRALWIEEVAPGEQREGENQ